MITMAAAANLQLNNIHYVKSGSYELLLPAANTAVFLVKTECLVSIYGSRAANV